MPFSLNFMAYFQAVFNNVRFRISSAVTFGVVLLLILPNGDNPIKILFTILFLFPFCMLVVPFLEYICNAITIKIRRSSDWSNLSPEEIEFISYYIKNETKTRYVVVCNGTWHDSGIINPLVSKKILYLASNESEFRGNSWATAGQYLPFNIYDDAFRFYKKKLATTA